MIFQSLFRSTLSTTFASLLLLSTATVQADSHAETFHLHSNDIEAGKMLSAEQVFLGFGCEGGNQSPQLSWSNAPKGTKSFAITAYDPDAPTGSGWWHWQVVNIPATSTELATNAGIIDSEALPSQALQIENDFGQASFGGACPPKAHGEHRYQFTIHALSVENIDVTSQSSAALVGYFINANAIASSTIEAIYKRD